MKKTLLISAIALAALALGGCRPNEDVLSVSKEKIELGSGAQHYTVTSSTGFYLDEIKQDGKTISIRTDHTDGTLLLDGGWIVVRTPEARSKELAHGMLITVTRNTGDSSRECQVIVHKGEKTKKITVNQKSPKDE